MNLLQELTQAAAACTKPDIRYTLLGASHLLQNATEDFNLELSEAALTELNNVWLFASKVLRLAQENASQANAIEVDGKALTVEK